MLKLAKLITIALTSLLICYTDATAGIVTKPYTFVAGTLIQSSQVNADLDTLYAVVNGLLDHNNLANGAGIWASDIKPNSTVAATFGGSFGYTFDPNVAGQVPLTIIGATAQSADLLDVFSVSQTTKYVWVDSGGVLHTNQSMAFGGVPTWTGALPVAQGGTGSTTQNFVDLSSAQIVGGAKTFTSSIVFSGNIGATWSSGQTLTDDGSGTHGLNINTASGTALGLRYFEGSPAGGTACNQFHGGAIYATSNGCGNTETPVPPVYTTAGAAVAGTLHGVVGTISVTINGSCPNNTLCGLNSSQATFSGAAVFASASSYSCSMATQTQAVIIPFPSPNSGSILIANAYNDSGGTLTNGSGPYVISYFCVGT